MYIFETEIFGINIAPSYYGLMYVIGFLAGFYIIKHRNRIVSSSSFIRKKKNILDDLLIYMVLGVVIGGRLGYTLLYNFSSYINDPISILKVWEGGMSFHGGVIGVIIAMILFSRKFKIDFYKLADQITLILPIGLGFGRIGNYLNGELLGYGGYNGIFAIYKNGIGYFPSPLVEFLLEGVVLFILLNLLYKHRKFSSGQIASLFLILYGVFRIFVEAVFREPDSHIGYILNYFTLGEIYSLPMIVFGIYFYLKLKKKHANI